MVLKQLPTHLFARCHEISCFFFWWRPLYFFVLYLLYLLYFWDVLYFLYYIYHILKCVIFFVLYLLYFDLCYIYYIFKMYYIFLYYIYDILICVKFFVLYSELSTGYFRKFETNNYNFKSGYFMLAGFRRFNLSNFK